MKAKDLIKLCEAEPDSNLAIKWVDSSPSTIAYFKKIGLIGTIYQDASIETPDGNEIWYAKVDYIRYIIDSDKNKFIKD